MGIDGMRADILPLARTPNLDGLIQRGAWSTTARVQEDAPAISGPGWASILTGVEARRHGVYGNDPVELMGRDRRAPTFFGRAHRVLGLRTAASVHWVTIMLMVEPGAVDRVEVGDDDRVTSLMADMIAEGGYDLHFVHLDAVDAAGHRTGFDLDNPDYLRAVEETDLRLGRLLEAISVRPERAEEQWLVVVGSDHGGEGRSHGARTPANERVLLILAGDGVERGRLRAEGVSQMDVHPIVLEYLGLSPQPGWGLDGRVRGLPCEWSQIDLPTEPR